MDVACDIVNVTLVNDYLGVSALYEVSPQDAQFRILVHRIDLRTGHNAVPHFHVTETQCVLEDLNLLLNLLLILDVLNIALNQVIQIHLSEGLLLLGLLHFLTHDSQQQFADGRSELTDGPQYDIEDVGGDGKYVHHAVGVQLEKRLGQKLARYQHHQRTYNRLGKQAEHLVGAVPDSMMDAQGNEDEAVDKPCHQYAVYDQRYVVSDQQGRDKVVGVPVEGVYQPRGESPLLAFHLKAQFAA